MSTKTLDDVKADMSELYEDLKAGDRGARVAGVLANIAGKYLKAEALMQEDRRFRVEFPDFTGGI